MDAFNRYIKKASFTIHPYISNYLSDYIIYFESEKFEVLNICVKNHLFEITNRIILNFSDLQFQIIKKQKKGQHNEILQALTYRYPNLNKKKLLEKLKDYIFRPDKFLTSIIQLEKGFSSGFIDFKKNEIIQFVSTNSSDIKCFLSSYFSDDNTFLFDPKLIEDSDDYLPLDEEVKLHLKQIEDVLFKLKQKGVLLQVLPIIDEYIKNTFTEPDALSRLEITSDYKIILTDYYSLEIKMSHLTKAVYFMFLKNRRKGIVLSEIYKYEIELLNIYKKISNRNDFDKMKNSIKDLINPKSNAINIHLSRIKSAFVKHIHPTIAMNYYVTGYKRAPKKIICKNSHINDSVLKDDDFFDSTFY